MGDPGSGRVQVYDDALNHRLELSLRPGTAPPTLNACAVTNDGHYLLVSSGTSSGSLFEEQPGRLFVVDPQLGTVVHVIDLGEWRSREVYAF